MSIIDESLKEQLKQYLTNLQKDVILEASLDDSKTAEDMKNLLKEISSLSDKVSYSENGNNERKPSFSIKNKTDEISLTFAAIPLGHEFTSLVLSILQVGGHPIKISDEIKNSIKNIKEKLDFTTYMSLSCQNCPDVVQAINIMAILNPNISNTSVDGALFKEEVEEKNIMAVPMVHLNGNEFSSGRTSVEEILQKLGSYDNSKDIEKLNNKEPFETLIIGAGPAGSAAAIYLARKDVRVGVIAKNIGGQILDTMSIENFIATKHTEGPKLARQLEEHMKEYNIDIMNAQTVEKIEKENDLYKINCASGAILRAKTIIISTGARWRKMGVPGEEKYIGKGIAFCPHCDGPLFRDKSIAVIGGGNSGVESAIDLSKIVKDITLIEFAENLRADLILQKQMEKIDNIKVIKCSKIEEVYGDGNKLTSAKYINVKEQTTQEINLDGIFVQIGLLPNTEWLEDFVETNPRKEIVIDNKCKTSKEGIFAAGDVTNVPYKQIIIAMGEGAKAALSAYEHLMMS